MRHETAAFASGRLDLRQVNIISDPTDKLARHFGYRSGCPVVPRQIDAQGAEAVTSRFAQLNFWYGHILTRLEFGNKPEIAEEFRSQIPRRNNEPRGDFVPTVVPPSHEVEMVGIGSPLGFALPRLLLEFVGKDDFKKKNRFNTGLDALDATVAMDTSTSALTFILNFAESLRNKENEENRNILGTGLLRQLLRTDKLTEDNCRTAFGEIVATMQENAPGLWSDYQQLSEERKSELHIADISIS